MKKQKSITDEKIDGFMALILGFRNLGKNEGKFGK